jgi:hypothetical protein
LLLSRSSVLNETDHVGLLAESLTAEHEVVLPDETFVTVGDSAAAAFFAVLSGVRAELMRHVGVKTWFYKNIFFHMIALIN